MVLPTLLLSALLLQTQGADSQVVYRNDDYGFQLAVPAGWERSPDAIARLDQVRGKLPNAETTRYPAAFRRTGSASPVPFVVIEVIGKPDDPLPPPGRPVPGLDSVATLLQHCSCMPGMSRRPPFLEHMGTYRYAADLDAVVIPLRLRVPGGKKLLALAGLRVSPRGALVGIIVYGGIHDSLATSAVRDSFIAGLAIDPRPADEPVYRNDTYGFDITVPEGWVRVPAPLVEQRIAYLHRNGARENETHFVASFARADARGWFAYPYVVIQVEAPDEPLGPDDTLPPLDSVAVWLDQEPVPETKNRLFTSPPRTVTHHYDSGRQAVLIEIGRGQVQGRWVRGYGGMRLTRGGALVSVLSFGFEEDSLATAQTRDRFLEALRVRQEP